MEKQEVEQQLASWQKDMKEGWIASLIITVSTVFIAVLGHFIEDVFISTGADLWLLVEATVFGLLTWGAYKKKRYSFLWVTIVYIGYKLFALIFTQSNQGLLLSIVLAYYLIKGTRASFQYHKYHVEQSDINGIPKRKSMIKYIVSGVVAVCAIAVVWFIAWAQASPETYVISGKMLPSRYITYLQQETIIRDGEEIEYWYSDGYSDISEGLYFFTKDTIVLHNKEWIEKTIRIPLNRIVEMEFIRDESFFTDSFIWITLDDGIELSFPVSSEHDGDLRFYDRLHQLWVSPSVSSTSTLK